MRGAVALNRELRHRTLENGNFDYVCAALRKPVRQCDAAAFVIHRLDSGTSGQKAAKMPCHEPPGEIIDPTLCGRNGQLHRRSCRNCAAARRGNRHACQRAAKVRTRHFLPLPLGERDAAPALAGRKSVRARLGEGCVLSNLGHKVLNL